MVARDFLAFACLLAFAALGIERSLAAHIERTGQKAGRPTRSRVWSVPGSPRGIPAVDARSVYFLTIAHEVVALDAATGTVRWRATTNEPGTKTSGSSIVLSGSLIVAGDYNVVAFDAVSGRVRWRFEPVEGFGPGLFLGATADDVVLTGSPAGRLYAIDRQNGTLRWSTHIPSDVPTTVFEPVADVDVVVASYTTFTVPPTGGVLALDIRGGSVRWRSPFPPSDVPMQSTAAGGGPVIIGRVILAASATGSIYAFDRTNGHVQWLLPPDEQTQLLPVDPARPDFRALTRSGSALLAASLTGRITAYNLRSRNRLWRTPEALLGSAGLRISSDDQLAYVPYVGGILRALRLEDGSEQWRLGSDEEAFLWPPRPAGDRLYVGSSKGFVCIAR
jgi:PQQ-like domain